MDKLFTNLRFTSEDIEALDLKIAKVNAKFDDKDIINKQIKKWCRANCSASWGHSITPKTWRANRESASIHQYPGSYYRCDMMASYYYIFTDDMDILSLSLAFDEIAIRCMWPTRMEFNMFLVGEDD